VINQKLLVPVQSGDPMLWTHFETKKNPPVLVAARDLPTGVTLTEADLEVREYREDLLTESFVLSHDRPHVTGQTAIAPFRKGDPILWTHFRPSARAVTASGAVK
jgi:Flp pilus assembly protein CpaB